jgi:hypothetical protein
MGRYAQAQKRGGGRTNHAGGFPQDPPVDGDSFAVEEDDATHVLCTNTQSLPGTFQEQFQLSIVGPSGPFINTTLIISGSDASVAAIGNTGTVWVRCRYVTTDGFATPQSDWSLVHVQLLA